HIAPGEKTRRAFFQALSSARFNIGDGAVASMRSRDDDRQLTFLNPDTLGQIEFDPSSGFSGGRRLLRLKRDP
ncbi:MAG: hypothetical protein ACK49R_04110, partial [Planctomycetota bacterium]